MISHALLCVDKKGMGFSFHPSTHIIASLKSAERKTIFRRKKPQTAA
jgi:hypothetical protein